MLKAGKTPENFDLRKSNSFCYLGVLERAEQERVKYLENQQPLPNSKKYMRIRKVEIKDIQEREKRWGRTRSNTI